MALSKPSEFLFELTGAYFQQLYANPVKTKAITSCVLAVLSNYTSQKLAGAKYLNLDSLVAFGLFGLLFAGPLPHFFQEYVYLFVRHPLGVLLIERLVFTPCFQALSLYFLARFEGKSHQVSEAQLKKLYLPALVANWKYLTLLQYINIRYVPPMLRVLVRNVIGFLWSVYLATLRNKSMAKDKSSRN